MSTGSASAPDQGHGIGNHGDAGRFERVLGLDGEPPGVKQVLGVLDESGYCIKVDLSLTKPLREELLAVVQAVLQSAIEGIGSDHFRQCPEDSVTTARLYAEKYVNGRLKQKMKWVDEESLIEQMEFYGAASEGVFPSEYAVATFIVETLGVYIEEMVEEIRNNMPGRRA